MHEAQTHESKIHHAWTTGTTVYLTIAGILLLFFISEYTLYSSVLTYCFIKVHKKARDGITKFMSVFVLLALWVSRLALLAMVASSLPLPHFVKSPFHSIDKYAGYVSFSLYGSMFVLPALVNIYQIASLSWKNRRKAEVLEGIPASDYPRVIIVMPVYNEEPEALFEAICSAVDNDYPHNRVHLFISFDGDTQQTLYRATLKNLGVPSESEHVIYPPMVDLVYRGAQITILQFPHGGKRLTQKKTIAVVNAIYELDPKIMNKMFVLFIDSDIVLASDAITSFIWDMQLNPNSSKDIIAMTGVITVRMNGKTNFVTMIQCLEYVYGQMYSKIVESATGGVTCLPGALTILRYKEFLETTEEYFAEHEAEDLFDFGETHLGEDRYLTHLFLLKAPKSHKVQFCQTARCKTEAPGLAMNLLKQRRRWFMGFITNEIMMLSDYRLWKKYPFLFLFRFLHQVTENMSIFVYVFVTGVICGLKSFGLVLSLAFAGSITLSWMFMVYYGVTLNRYRAWFYPLLYLVGPFFNWICLVHGILTSNQRTWGGPRTDAEKNGSDLKQEKAQLWQLSNLYDPDVVEAFEGKWWTSSKSLEFIVEGRSKRTLSIALASKNHLSPWHRSGSNQLPKELEPKILPRHHHYSDTFFRRFSPLFPPFAISSYNYKVAPELTRTFPDLELASQNNMYYL